jgi:hypothetical protein
MYIHPDILKLKQYNKDVSWIQFQEFWVRPDWSDQPDPFRISFYTPFSQSSGTLSWRVRAQQCCSSATVNYWEKNNKTVAVPIGEWFTAETYYKMGDKNNGRISFSIQKDGGPKQMVFDVTDITHHPDHGPEGLFFWNTHKLYVDPVAVDFIRSKGGMLQFYWDDWEVWSTVPPQATNPPANLVGNWKFNEGSGSTAGNSTGGNPGTLTGTPTWVNNGQVGAALDFNGGADRVAIPGGGALANLNSYTVALWFFADSTGDSGQGRLLEKDDSFGMRFSNYNSQIYFDADRWSSSAGKWRFNTGQSLLGGWHHLVLTYDYSSTNNNPALYLDGTQIINLEELSTPGGSVASDTGALAIGNRAAGGRSFDGRIDEVQIYNRVLTPQEAWALFAGG